MWPSAVLDHGSLQHVCCLRAPHFLHAALVKGDSHAVAGDGPPHTGARACMPHAGSALTTFNKGGCVLAPKVIAHRSSATRGDMLVNTRAYRQFCHKARLKDNVRCCWPGLPCFHHRPCRLWDSARPPASPATMALSLPKLRLPAACSLSVLSLCSCSPLASSWASHCNYGL